MNFLEGVLQISRELFLDWWMILRCYIQRFHKKIYHMQCALFWKDGDLRCQIISKEAISGTIE